MADLRKVRIQVIDPKTGQVIENVDAKTSAGGVYMPDGTTLKDWIVNTEEVHSEFQQKLAAHLAAKHIEQDKIDDVLVGLKYDETTGKFQVTKHNGAVQEIDTLLEKMPIKFELVDGEGETEGEKFIRITLDDGTVQNVNLTDFIDIYTGSEGDHIVITVDEQTGEIQGRLVDKSIKMAQLSDEVTAAIAEQFELEAATASKLGGVKVGTGIDVAADGTISTKNVTIDGEAKNINFVEVASTVAIEVTGPTTSLLQTTVGTAVGGITITATATGTGASNATLAYQWYKKVIGKDSVFAIIDGAVEATLADANIDVTAAGTTVYYCRVSATGEGVEADPVASKQVTVVVI